MNKSIIMRELPRIPNKSFVYAQHSSGSEWYPVIILSQLRDRSYKIKFQNGLILVRNIKFMKLIKTPTALREFEAETESSKEKKKKVEPKIYMDSDNEHEQELDVSGEDNSQANTSTSSTEMFVDARMNSESSNSEAEER